jgi:folate-dependent phosphoribosylglycinamide formyltransferase PurN
MKKILFLGTKKNLIYLINKLKKNYKNISISQTKKKISLKVISRHDLVVSFGYKHVIEKKIIKNIKRPIINLHISYLPFNKGAHPNFWSFAENTPSGITIHEINDRIDGGNILFQKMINFDFYKNKKKLTYENSYKVLINEIQKLFLQNVKKIINNEYMSFPQIGKGSFHSKKDLPTILKSWKQNIFNTSIKFNNLRKKNIKKRLNILNQIENARKKNNINWMNIVRTSITNSPKNTLDILKKITSDDKKIMGLFKKLSK